MALLENPNYSDIAQALGIDVKGAKEKAFTEGLLGSIFQAAALSGPQPRPMSAAQALGQVGLAGYQGYKSAFDQQLKEALTGLQLKEALRKSQESEALRRTFPLAFNIQREPAPTTGAFEAGQGLDVMQGGQGIVPERAITGIGINRQMLPALMAIPGGIEAVKSLAETQKLLRQSGLAGEGGEAPSPFLPYLSAQSPQVKTLAQQLNTAFKSGLITEEDAYKRLEPLARMEEAFVSKQGGPPSGEERKAAFLANRVKFGLQQMADVLKTNAPAASPEMLPSIVKFITQSDYLSTKLTSSDRQRIEAAQLDILDAALTLGTGAAYTKEQLDAYRKSYFPQLGNDKATIADKQRRLENLLESAYISVGRASPSLGQRPTFNQPETPSRPTEAGGAKPSLKNILFPNRG